MDNLSVLTKALSHLTKRYEETERGLKEYSPIEWQPFFDSLADDVEFEVPCSVAPPEGDPAWNSPPWNVIGRVHRGKQALIKAFAADQEDVRNWEVKQPMQYFIDATSNRIVVLHTERYTVKRADDAVVPWTHTAMVFDFRDGKIVRYRHIADLSAHVAAHASRPVG